MRVGQNPLKNKKTLLKVYKHRVVIPFYIPDSTDPFFNGLLDAFKLCLKSLINTINLEDTVITLINNNSCVEATKFAESLVKQGTIGEYICLNENRGKVNPFLKIAKSCKEPIITLCDADVLVYNNWEKTVFKAFNDVSKAGAVTPVVCPHLSMDFANAKTIISLFFKNKIKFGSVISQSDFINIFVSFGKTEDFAKKNKLYKKQFFFTKNNTKYTFGASHYVISYRTEVFKHRVFDVQIPEVFYDGIEYFNIDCALDRIGYYKIATTKSFAYHLGNTIPDAIKKYIPKEVNSVTNNLTLSKLNKTKIRFLPNKFSEILFYFIKKYYYKRLNF